MSDHRRVVKGIERCTERFTIRLHPRLRDAIERAASADRRSPSDWIVIALEKACGLPPPTPDVAAALGLPKPRRRAK
jgi:hypothetical protein